jgi:hypothetical protein
MAVTQFNQPSYDTAGALWVSGPFDPENATILGSVIVPFLLVQDPPDPGAKRLIAQGFGTWSHGNANWGGKVTGGDVAAFDRSKPVRGIGAAILVRDTNPGPTVAPANPYPNPPVIEVVTWCVTQTFADSPPAPPASDALLDMS